MQHQRTYEEEGEGVVVQSLVVETHALDVELAMVVEGFFAILGDQWARRLVVELHFRQALHSHIAGSCGYSNGGFIYLFQLFL